MDARRKAPRNLAHDLIRRSLVHNSSRRRSGEVTSAAFCSLNRSEGENHGSWFFNDPGLFVPWRHTGCVCVCVSGWVTTAEHPSSVDAPEVGGKTGKRLRPPVVRLAKPSRLKTTDAPCFLPSTSSNLKTISGLELLCRLPVASSQFTPPPRPPLTPVIICSVQS